MSGDLTPESPRPAAVGRPNPFQRIVGVFATPTRTFASIAERPDILWPLVIFIGISFALSVALAQRIDFASLARDAMAMNPQTAHMPAEKLERMTSFTTATMKVSTYAGPLLSGLVLAIAAGIMLIAFRLMAGEGDFKQAFSATTYAWYPRLLKSLLGVIVLLSKRSVSLTDLQNPLRSNLAFLVDAKAHPVQFSLLTSFDLFSIWSIVLTIIGFAALSKLSRTKSSFIVVILWAIGILFSLIPPMLQSLGTHS